MQINHFIEFVRDHYSSNEFIPLHAPNLSNAESNMVDEALRSTFVSSVGKFVDLSEDIFSKICSTKSAVAVVNGTAALHIALKLAGAGQNTEVITQALTFVATANAISYNNATPVFLDVNYETMGLSPKSVSEFLEEFAVVRSNGTYNRITGKQIVACVPMHTFGFPAQILELKKICKLWNITLIEDAAEALGSKLGNQSLGTFGEYGTFSFNGNKIVTCGGGGMLITDNVNNSKKAKHLTTTAKIPHKFEYIHDMVGFNYRLPNLNAALLVAQLGRLQEFLYKKRMLAKKYEYLFNEMGVKFRKEQEGTTANYWLMCLELSDNDAKSEFLEKTNAVGVMTRPIWELMFNLPMFKDCYRDEQLNAKALRNRIVNIPSSVL